MAFCVPNGHFEFNISSFGLCNAPATFQHLMSTVLAVLQWERCLVYLDDIILGKTFDDYIAALSQVSGTVGTGRFEVETL